MAGDKTIPPPLKFGNFLKNRQQLFFRQMHPRTLSNCVIKPRQIACSVFFLLDYSGQTQVSRLVPCQPDVWSWKNHGFWTKDEDFEKCYLKLCRTATAELGQIVRSVLFYWNTTDKLEFTHWFQVNRMFVCGETAIFPTEDDD